jgi:hypothetical protein
MLKIITSVPGLAQALAPGLAPGLAPELVIIQNPVAEPPAPPTGIQILEVTSQTVRLSWQSQNDLSVTPNSPEPPRITKYIVETAEVQGNPTQQFFSQLRK